MSGRARRGAAPRHAAAETAVPDVLAPGLKVVFCGINPGFVSAAAGAHFANPRNDFWRLLAAAGLTSRLYEPSEQFEVLGEGIGLTNAAARTTRGSGDLRRGDFDRARLERIASELEPRAIAFVGKEAFRGVFGERPELGPQSRTLGDVGLFVLPSTSPANAAVPYEERLRWFDELSGRSSGKPLSNTEWSESDAPTTANGAHAMPAAAQSSSRRARRSSSRRSSRTARRRRARAPRPS